MLIWYFNGPVLSKKCGQKSGLGKKIKKGDDHKRGLPIEGGVQTFCTQW